MGWVRRFFIDWLISKAIDKIVGLVIGAMLSALYTWWSIPVHLNWPLIGMIAIAIFLAGIIAYHLVIRTWVDKYRIKLSFCDNNGKEISIKPYMNFWPMDNDITFVTFAQFSIRLKNLTNMDITIENAYLSISAKRNNLLRKNMDQFKNIRLRSYDVMADCIPFHTQVYIDKHNIEKVLGVNYEQAKVDLIIEAVGAKGKYTFPVKYRSFHEQN
jgi:hypothetical protein